VLCDAGLCARLGRFLAGAIAVVTARAFPARPPSFLVLYPLNAKLLRAATAHSGAPVHTLDELL
jgi:hypothetical protein